MNRSVKLWFSLAGQLALCAIYVPLLMVIGIGVLIEELYATLKTAK